MIKCDQVNWALFQQWFEISNFVFTYASVFFKIKCRLFTKNHHVNFEMSHSYVYIYVYTYVRKCAFPGNLMCQLQAFKCIFAIAGHAIFKVMMEKSPSTKTAKLVIFDSRLQMTLENVHIVMLTEHEKKLLKPKRAKILSLCFILAKKNRFQSSCIHFTFHSCMCELILVIIIFNDSIIIIKYVIGKAANALIKRLWITFSLLNSKFCKFILFQVLFLCTRWQHLFPIEVEELHQNSPHLWMSF